MVSSLEPQVTVAIPTFNRAPILARAIRSALEQSLRDIEVIVADNASTDDTAKVVESFGDPRLHYFRHPMNIGLHANLSGCLRLGRAPLVAVLPDDDVMLPENLRKKASVLNSHPEVAMVHSAFDLAIIGRDGRETLRKNVSWISCDKDTIDKGMDVVRRLLTEPYTINLPSMVLRRSFVENESFRETEGPTADLGLCLRLAHRGDIAYLARPLVVHYVHPEADNVRAGTNELETGAYLPTFKAAALALRTKKRFLREYGANTPSLGALRTATRRSGAGALLFLIRDSFQRGRPIGSVARGVAEIARVDPIVLFTPQVMRFMFKRWLGPRGLAIARRGRAVASGGKLYKRTRK